jgi:hypothetical protein
MVCLKLEEEHSLRIFGKRVLRGVFEIKKVERYEAVENYIKESFMNFISHRILLKNAKESRNRPGVSQRVPGVLGFQIS